MINTELSGGVDLAIIDVSAHPKKGQHNRSTRRVAWYLADGVAELIDITGYFLGRVAHRNGLGDLAAEIGASNLAIIQTLTHRKPREN
jgi:hypothetical protein